MHEKTQPAPVEGFTEHDQLSSDLDAALHILTQQSQPSRLECLEQTDQSLKSAINTLELCEQEIATALRVNSYADTALTYFVERAPIDLNPGKEARVYQLALTVAEQLTGVSCLSWREWRKQADLDGQKIPNYIDHFLDRRDIAGHYFLREYRRLEQHYGIHLANGATTFSDKGLEALDRTTNAVLNYAMELDSPTNIDEKQGLVRAFMMGDLMQFGYFPEVDNSWQYDDITPDQKRISAIFDYVANVESLGALESVRIYKTYGIVNFGRYTKAQLKTMHQVITGQVNGNGLPLLISGRMGDHNGAFQQIKRAQFESTLAIEIQTAEDLTTIRNNLRSYGVESFAQLILAGHGDDEGIALSNECLLKRNKKRIQQSPLREFTSDVVPDVNGRSRVVLDSCQQGRVFDLRGSMAQLMAKALGVTVYAADGKLMPYYQPKTMVMRIVDEYAKPKAGKLPLRVSGVVAYPTGVQHPLKDGRVFLEEVA